MSDDTSETQRLPECANCHGPYEEDPDRGGKSPYYYCGTCRFFMEAWARDDETEIAALRTELKAARTEAAALRDDALRDAIRDEARWWNSNPGAGAMPLRASLLRIIKAEQGLAIAPAPGGAVKRPIPRCISCGVGLTRSEQREHRRKCGLCLARKP